MRNFVERIAPWKITQHPKNAILDRLIFPKLPTCWQDIANISLGIVHLIMKQGYMDASVTEVILSPGCIMVFHSHNAYNSEDIR